MMKEKQNKEAVSTIHGELVAHNNITPTITTLQHANKEHNKIKMCHLRYRWITAMGLNSLLINFLDAKHFLF
jgi:hypothetical protein